VCTNGGEWAIPPQDIRARPLLASDRLDGACYTARALEFGKVVGVDEPALPQRRAGFFGINGSVAMATIREYYDTDFSYTVRVHARLTDGSDSGTELSVLYDFSGYNAFLACYLPGEHHSLRSYVDLLQKLASVGTSVQLGKGVTLPSARNFHGKMQVGLINGQLQVSAQFWGDPAWLSLSDIATTSRIFIYSESDLTPDEIIALKHAGKEMGGKECSSDRRGTQRGGRSLKSLWLLSAMIPGIKILLPDELLLSYRA
jgi:hypothetical protein